ncbi:PocR ligand-binding domain-containing protein [bacterium]|nr:PocR ligand-binding domain-containing protein [bacterium]
MIDKGIENPVLDNIEFELELEFLQTEQNSVDYLIYSFHYTNLLEHEETSTPDENIPDEIIKAVAELLNPENTLKYFLTTNQNLIINENIYLPLAEKYLHLSVLPLNYNKAKIVFKVCLHNNNHEENSVQLQNKYFLMLENSCDAVTVIDENWVPLYSSPATKELLGCSPKEKLTLHPFDVIHYEDVPLVLEKFKQVKSHDNQVISLKCRLKRSNNTYVKVEIKAKNCLNTGDIKGIVINMRDITEQEQISQKIDSLINQRGDTSQLELIDLIDFEELHNLMEIFYQFNNIPIGLVDLEGNILTSIGMTEICKQYHRENKIAAKRCLESDLKLTKVLEKDEIRAYKCLNNMNDLVSPIIVADKHLANLFIGQFFYEDEAIDREVFRQQAKDFEIDEEDYLTALDKVPRLNREKIILVAKFYRDFLRVITNSAHSRLKLLTLNHQIEQREEKLQQITDNMTDVVFTTDFEFNIKYISPSIKKLTGYSPREYIKLSMEERYPPLAVKEIREAIALELEQDDQIANKNRTNINMLAMYNKEKSLVIASIHSKFIRDRDDKPIAVIANIRDITKQYQVEKELEKQLKLQSLLSTIAVNYINIPTKNIDVAINESLAQLATFVKADRAYIFRYDWENKISINTYEWVADGVTREKENLQEVPLSEMEYWPETHKQGKTIFIDDLDKLVEYPKVQQILKAQGVKSLITIPLMKDKKCVGFVGFDSVKSKNIYSDSEQTILAIFAELLVNISHRIDLENDLRTEREKAQNSDILNSNLLKNISHEFRTPLNGIVGFSEMLQHKSSDFETGNMAGMIYSSAMRLNHVLDSIMLLTQLEDIEKRKSICLKLTNVSKIIYELNSLFKDQFSDKGLSFYSEIEPNLYSQLDEKLLTQALIHLLNNALKFTHNGGIQLLCYTQRKDIVIDVIDSGIGIPNELLKVIFSEFRQASEGYNRAYEGVGLGLTIANKIVSLMHGEIQVKSKILSGSTFTIKLLRQAAPDINLLENQTKINPGLSHIHCEKPKVLIVEDNIINQKLIISILKNDYLTDLAVNGEVAVILAEKKKYDTILMDIHLGEGIDGLTATRIIKSNSKNITTPVIAVTGYTMIGDKERILADGCNYYISKPYKKDLLLDTINKAMTEH